MSGGEFDWGGRLRKSIGGAQRFPQNGRKPFAECKGIRELDCDTDGGPDIPEGFEDFHKGIEKAAPFVKRP